MPHSSWFRFGSGACLCSPSGLGALVAGNSPAAIDASMPCSSSPNNNNAVASSNSTGCGQVARVTNPVSSPAKRLLPSAVARSRWIAPIAARRAHHPRCVLAGAVQREGQHRLVLDRLFQVHLVALQRGRAEGETLAEVLGEALLCQIPVDVGRQLSPRLDSQAVSLSRRQRDSKPTSRIATATVADAHRINAAVEDRGRVRPLRDGEPD
jgi:hypothetical protein